MEFFSLLSHANDTMFNTLCEHAFCQFEQNVQLYISIYSTTYGMEASFPVNSTSNWMQTLHAIDASVDNNESFVVWTNQCGCPVHEKRVSKMDSITLIKF